MPTLSLIFLIHLVSSDTIYYNNCTDLNTVSSSSGALSLDYGNDWIMIWGDWMQFDLDTTGYTSIKFQYSIEVNPGPCIVSYIVGNGDRQTLAIYNASTIMHLFYDEIKDLGADASDTSDISFRFNNHGEPTTQFCSVDELYLFGTPITPSLTANPSSGSTSTPSPTTTLEGICSYGAEGYIDTEYEISTAICIENTLEVIYDLIDVIDVVYNGNNIVVQSAITKEAEQALSDASCGDTTIRIKSCFYDETDPAKLKNITESRKFREDVKAGISEKTNNNTVITRVVYITVYSPPSPPSKTNIDPANINQIPSLFISFCIICIFVIFGIISLFDAKCIRRNDYFQVKVILFAGLEVCDTFLDGLFAIFVTAYYLKTGDTQFLIVMIGSYAFIVLPITFSIYQLYHKIHKKWINNDNLRHWLAENGKGLYFLSILFGSSYTAISMVNCGALKLDLFNMGLTKYQRIQYDTKRIVGIICFENIPQIFFQIWYLSIQADLLPVVSVLASFVSIIITILSICTQRSIVKNHEFIQISFDITGDGITPPLSTKTNVIKSELSIFVGISEKLMEIPKPSMISNGLRFTIYLFINNKYGKELDYQSVMNDAVNNGKLVDIFKTKWDLTTETKIKNLKFEEIKSKEQDKNTATELQTHHNEENMNNPEIDVNSNHMKGAKGVTNTTLGDVDDDNNSDETINGEYDSVKL